MVLYLPTTGHFLARYPVSALNMTVGRTWRTTGLHPGQPVTWFRRSGRLRDGATVILYDYAFRLTVDNCFPPLHYPATRATADGQHRSSGFIWPGPFTPPPPPRRACLPGSPDQRGLLRYTGTPRACRAAVYHISFPHGFRFPTPTTYSWTRGGWFCAYGQTRAAHTCLCLV